MTITAKPSLSPIIYGNKQHKWGWKMCYFWVMSNKKNFIFLPSFPSLHTFSLIFKRSIKSGINKGSGRLIFSVKMLHIYKVR